MSKAAEEAAAAAASVAGTTAVAEGTEQNVASAGEKDMLAEVMKQMADLTNKCDKLKESSERNEIVIKDYQVRLKTQDEQMKQDKEQNEIEMKDLREEIKNNTSNEKEMKTKS